MLLHMMILSYKTCPFFYTHFITPLSLRVSDRLQDKRIERWHEGYKFSSVLPVEKILKPNTLQPVEQPPQDQ